MTHDESLDLPETIDLPCPCCGRVNVWPVRSNTGQGVFNAFCPDNGGECEDRFAARQ